MFGTQALRLLREKWPNATMLAEELYAIFDDTNPTSSGPIKIAQPAGTPPPGITPEVFDVPPWAPLTFGSGPDATSFQIAPDGGLTISSPSVDFTTPDGKPLKPMAQASTFPGQVQSGGPGQGPYTVDVYQKGLGQPPTSMPVTQLQIAENDTVPVGTWVLVAVTDFENFMQAPVWLDDLE
jgi:hypothetical protein